MVSNAGTVTSDRPTTGDRARFADMDTPVARYGLVRPVSWSAVIAGGITAAVTQILLTLLGVGIGMAAMDPTLEADPTEGMGTGAAIWGVLSAIISLAAGGWMAGYVAGLARMGKGLMHGLLVWALATLLSVYLVSTAAASLVGGGMSVIARAGGEAVGQPGARLTIADIANVGTPNAANTGAAAPDAAGTGVNATGAERTAADRAAEAVRRNAPTEAEVREYAERAANATSKAAFWTFAALLLGAVAAAFGGNMGDRAGRTLAEREIRTAAPAP